MRLDHVRGAPGSRNRLEAQVWEGARVEADPAVVPEPTEVEVPESLRKAVERYMARYPDFHSAAIPALHAAQEHHGWLSPEAMVQVATVMRVTPAYLEAVATFYDMFELQPAGRHIIYVCTNLSCGVCGAGDLLYAFSRATGAPVGGNSADGQFRLRSFECLGACDIAPMASIDGHYRGPLTAQDAELIADHLRADRPVEELLPDKAYEAIYRHGGAGRPAVSTSTSPPTDAGAP